MNNNLIKNLLFIIILLFVLFKSSYSQNGKYFFDRISNNDGLSQATVTSIIQDHQGFMWFGTYDGLNRYDGIRFKIYKYDVEDTLSISNSSITAICEDRLNNLWVGTVGGGLNSFNREKEEFIRFQNNPNDSTSISNNIVKNIFEDHKGNLWIATWGGGLNLFNYKTNKFTRFSHNPNNQNSLSSNYISTIDEDEFGNLWLSTTKGLCKFNFKTSEFEKFTHDPNIEFSISSNDVSAVFVDPNGYIWAGTWGQGLNKFDPETKKFKRFMHIPYNPNTISHNIIRFIHKENLGNLYLATWGGGLELFNTKTERFTHIKNDPIDQNSLSGGFVYTIYMDDLDILWVGTDFKGISKYDKKKQKFAHYKKFSDNNTGLIGNTVFSIVEDSDGIMWFGTNRGLNSFNPKTQKFQSYVSDPDDPNTLSNNVIRSIIEEDGILWIATEIGLNRFDLRTGIFKRYLHDPNNINSISSTNVYLLFIDSYDQMWIGTYSGGLSKFDRTTETFIHYRYNLKDPTSIGSNFFWSIIEDIDGYIWMGSDDNGVSRYDRNNDTFKSFKHINHKNSISGNKVLCILEASNGILWIGTTSGLNRYDRKHNIVKHYFKKDGLPSNSIQGILEDDENNLWISTNNGLSKFNSINETFQNFNVSDGLQSNEFGVNSCYKARNGQMYFGGINGFNVFHPSKISYNPNIPPVVITGFKLFNKEVPIDNVSDIKSILQKSITETNEITLSYKQNVISFEFAALNYSHPERNQYAYIMENFESDWNYVGNKSEASYTNLDPGKYIFKVKASNNDGLWNETGTSISIIITPPFWQTWWFRFSILFFIIGTFLSFYFYRISNLKKQKIYLEKIVKERTHEIEEKNKILTDQTFVLNETNTLLNERQQYIEEQSEELKANAEELNIKNKDLQKSNATKDKLFSIIAHDIKSPFNSILGFSELLNINYNTYPDTKKQRFVKLIHDASRSVYELLENLLQWSRSQISNISYNPQEFELNELIEQNILLIKNIVENKGLVITNEISNKHTVYADRIMVNTVIRNLLGNAIKFTENGNITFKASNRKNNITVKIIDTGLGMTKEKIKEIIDTSNFTSTEGTRGETGTGLGLIICQEFIKRNKGKISIKSTVGKGTEFSFTIPAASD
ncbi:two-component regulator propeller domain-containing protein [Bacteroidota bacterium]